MAYIADLVTPNQVIFFFMPDFSIPGLKKSQEFIATLDVDKIIFSHSAKEDPLAPGTKEDVTFFVKYLDDIQAAVGRTTNRSTLSGHVTSVLISDWPGGAQLAAGREQGAGGAAQLGSQARPRRPWLQ